MFLNLDACVFLKDKFIMFHFKIKEKTNPKNHFVFTQMSELLIAFPSCEVCENDTVLAFLDLFSYLKLQALQSHFENEISLRIELSVSLRRVILHFCKSTGNIMQTSIYCLLWNWDQNS